MSTVSYAEMLRREAQAIPTEIAERIPTLKGLVSDSWAGGYHTEEQGYQQCVRSELQELKQCLDAIQRPRSYPTDFKEIEDAIRAALGSIQHSSHRVRESYNWALDFKGSFRGWHSGEARPTRVTERVESVSIILNLFHLERLNTRREAAWPQFVEDQDYLDKEERASFLQNRKENLSEIYSPMTLSLRLFTAERFVINDPAEEEKAFQRESITLLQKRWRAQRPLQSEVEELRRRNAELEKRLGKTNKDDGWVSAIVADITRKISTRVELDRQREEMKNKMPEQFHQIIDREFSKAKARLEGEDE
jgi:hypothetical protein